MYSPEQIDRMVTARREFRVALRADILLLFNEDLDVDFLKDLRDATLKQWRANTALRATALGWR
jgi:hypothetical protein